MRARVYRNLNNGLWSIKQKVNGKWSVVGHCESCAINDVTPHVSGSYDRVRRDKTREVFAWLEGDLCWVRGFIPFRDREARTIDAFPARPFNRTTRVNFHPFADVKQGFVWEGEHDYISDNFEGAACAYFLESKQVWAR